MSSKYPSGAGPMDHNISANTGKNPPKRNLQNVDYRTKQAGEACPESQPAATDCLNVQPTMESGIGPMSSSGNPHGNYGSKEDKYGGGEMSY